MSLSSLHAPGAPGIPPKWTTSAKDGVATAISLGSSVSFTLSHGILNEIFFPRIDRAAIRDMELIITDGHDFFSEEKRNTSTVTQQIKSGIPSFKIINTCHENRFKITKEIITDPHRDSVVQRIKFKAIKKDQYQLYGLLAPHLDNQGMGNSAWVGDYKGHPMIFAQHNHVALAFTCSRNWVKRSVGFVGRSDGWQDLQEHYQMTWEFEIAEDGNVALMGEIENHVTDQITFDLVIGFGNTPDEAAHHALSSLMEGFGSIQKKYVTEWERWQEQIRHYAPVDHEKSAFFLLSASILKIHQSKNFPGAMIASMSTPWGDTMGDDDQSGYHLVWPRDMVECAGGLLALGNHRDALAVLNFLMVTQEPDGHWSQNLWLDGQPYWSGIQLDETALPILLIDLCMKEGALHEDHLRKYWRTVSKATSFLLKRGLITGQDRWEEQPGISTFTLATSIAGLLSAADLAEKAGEPEIAKYCRQTADAWYVDIDTWLYAKDNHITKKLKIGGYYLRVNPVLLPAGELHRTEMNIKNHPSETDSIPVIEMISTDPLALVRFGLRRADDPRIINTIKVIDYFLKKETINGDSWYRYVRDGYGEKEDGSNFRDTGIGRPWPLLTGERAHYEIAGGNIARAEELCKAMEKFSNNGLIPEQIWDQEDRPDRELFNGKHSGSAMPLVWAHAEYLKLVRSLNDQAIFDVPDHTRKRYLEDQISSDLIIWRKDLPVHRIPAGKILRLETISAARVRWSSDDWRDIKEEPTKDMGLGLHYLDLETNQQMKDGITFTFFWLEEERWEGTDFKVQIDIENDQR